MQRSSPSFAAQRTTFVAACLLALTIALTGLNKSASAQGTMGTVPDPISARELDGYAKRLRLSDQQRAALESYHDQYKLEFSALRDGDIQKFLTETAGASGGGRGGMGGMGAMFNTDRKQIQKSLKELEDILSRIKTLDNQLFDEAQSVLTEDQASQMQGVRQARERVRYRTGLSRMTSFMNPATQVDLSEYVADLDLSPDEKQAAGPVVSQYETSLTSAAHKLHDGASNMVMEMLDKLEKMGLGGDAARDPENRGKMFEAFRTIWGEVNGKLAEKAADITDLNRKTARALTPLLSEEHAHRLRDQYYARAYPEAAGSGGQASRAFDLALKMDELNDEQREAIAAMSAEYHTSADHLADQMADAIDANRKTQSMFDFGSDARRKHEEELSALRDKRSKINETSLASLKATLGPELTDKLEQRIAKGGGESRGKSGGETITLTAGGPGGMTFTAVAAPAVKSDASDASAIVIDPYIPGPISKRDVEDYAAKLHLDDANKDVLLTLHEDYLEKFKAIELGEIKATRDAEQNLWSMTGSDGQVTPPKPEAIDHLYGLRKQALESIKVADAEFFDNVKNALASPEQEPLVARLVQSRNREVFNRGSSGGMPSMFSFGRGGGGDRGGRNRGGNEGGRGGRGPGGMTLSGLGSGGSSESSVDLVAIVDDAKPKPNDPAQFDSMLIAYEQSVTAAFQKMYEASMKMQQTTDKLTAQMAAARGTGQGGPGGGDRQRVDNFGGGFREAMEGDGRIAREARQAIATLNRETLASLMTAMPEIDAQNLKRTYNRKAFANVYRDTRSAEPQISAALKLSDLNDQQRTQIQEISAEYRGGYDVFCDKLIEIEMATANSGGIFGMGGGGRGGSGGGGGGGGADWQAIQEQMRTREKIDFERNDLSDKTLTRLRATLNEDQIQRLGGLQSEANKQASN